MGRRYPSLLSKSSRSWSFKSCVTQASVVMVTGCHPFRSSAGASVYTCSSSANPVAIVSQLQNLTAPYHVTPVTG